MRDYEAAAKEIEAMGAEMIEAARKCEAMTAEVHLAIAYMHETAAAYREDAKRIFKRIEGLLVLDRACSPNLRGPRAQDRKQPDRLRYFGDLVAFESPGGRRSLPLTA